MSLVNFGFLRAAQIWDINLVKCIMELPPPSQVDCAHESDIRCCDVSACGDKIISGDGVGEIKLWHLRLPGFAMLLRTFRAHSTSVICCGYCESKKLVVSIGGEGTLKLFDAEGGACIRVTQTVNIHQGRMSAAQCHITACSLEVGTDLEVNRLATMHSQPDETETQPNLPCSSLNHTLACEVSDANQHISITAVISTSDGSTRLWNVLSGKCLHEMSTYACCLTHRGQVGLINC